MPPLINQVIPEQGFEKVRDTIGAIIFLELSNQEALGAFSDLSNFTFEVGIGRTRAADSAGPVEINVLLASGLYGSMTQQDAQGRTIYLIAFDVSGYEKDNEEGGYNSNKILHRLIGMVAYIFRSPYYRKMGLTGKVGGTYVEQFEILDPNRKEDSDFTTFGTLQIAVRIQEDTEAWEGVQLLGNDTIVKLDLTEKGYKFVFDN